MTCPRCQAVKRGRQNRLAIIILRKGGMHLKAIGGVLRLGRATTEWHASKIKRDNRIVDPCHFGAHFATTPQRDWVL